MIEQSTANEHCWLLGFRLYFNHSSSSNIQGVKVLKNQTGKLAAFWLHSVMQAIKEPDFKGNCKKLKTWTEWN